MHRILAIVFLSSILIATTIFANGGYLDRAEVKNFIDEFSKRHEYSKSSLTILLGKVKKQTEVLEAIQRPAEKKKNLEIDLKKYKKIKS